MKYTNHFFPARSNPLVTHGRFMDVHINYRGTSYRVLSHPLDKIKRRTTKNNYRLEGYPDLDEDFGVINWRPAVPSPALRSGTSIIGSSIHRLFAHTEEEDCYYPVRAGAVVQLWCQAQGHGAFCMCTHNAQTHNESWLLSALWSCRLWKAVPVSSKDNSRNAPKICGSLKK